MLDMISQMQTSARSLSELMNRYLVHTSADVLAALE